MTDSEERYYDRSEVDEIFRRAYLDVVLVATNLTSQSRRHDLHRDQLADAFAALALKRFVTDSKYFVDQEDVGVGIHGDGEP